MAMDKDKNDPPHPRQLSEAEELEAIKEGLRQADRGEGIPLEKWYRKMRKKYNLPARRYFAASPCNTAWTSIIFPPRFRHSGVLMMHVCKTNYPVVHRPIPRV